MILTAHQPAYIPWLGLFHKIALSDYYVFMDNVKFSKSDFSNRNKIIKKVNNDSQWLTIPLQRGGSDNIKFNLISIDNSQNWNKKHLEKMKENYGETPFFEKYFFPIEEILSFPHKLLNDLTYSILILLLDFLEIKKDIYKSSKLDIYSEGNNYLIDLCKELDANTYIFGEKGKEYANIELFKSREIKVYFQNYNHPVYNQNNDSFIPKMSVIDLLFNEGPNSYDILMSGNPFEIPK